MNTIPGRGYTREIGSLRKEEAAVSEGASKVWFTSMRTTKKRSLLTRVGELLERAGLADVVDEGDLVAVKLHFGELGNTAFIEPYFIREIVARVGDAGGMPFLTDANTLYRGTRANAVDHTVCALRNGFSYATVGAPIVIADGLTGHDSVEIEVPGGRHFDTVRIASAAVHADAMVVATHVKGHEAAGFGGALKNVGMGLGCRSAKQRMHADFHPEVDAGECVACGRCVKWCPVEAISLVGRVAVVDRELCYGCGECVAACPHGAIAPQWETEPQVFQEKMIEHAVGALAGKEEKTVYVSFVMRVTPDCDCWHFSDAPIVSDIGVLASRDPVAIDQAAYDLVTAAEGLPGSRGQGMGPGVDKFTKVTGVEGTHIMEYGERLGLGVRAYDIETLV